MENSYEEEVEEIEEILLDVDKDVIRSPEAIYKLMKLTLKYKKQRLKQLKEGSQGRLRKDNGK